MAILERKTYDPLPQGVYRERVVQVSEGQSAKFDQTQWKFEFAIAKPDGSTATLYGWANAVFTPKSKLSEWVRALLRRDPGELACLDSNDLVGAECQIVVGVRRRDDGSLGNMVTAVLPTDAPSADATWAAAADRTEDEVPF